jgi:hypothetical protein
VFRSGTTRKIAENAGWDACVCGSCQDDDCGGCAEGLTACIDDGGETECRNLLRDEEHCGDCDHSCAVGQECVDGACACPIELEDCHGVCVDTDQDLLNCGGCDQPCDGQCDGGVCLGGACGGDETLCFGTTCANLEEDPDNCGRCGTVCPGGACFEGHCGDRNLCDTCPCAACPSSDDPPQRCCFEEGGAVCVVTTSCFDE